MTRCSTRERDEDETKTPLFHWWSRGATRATVLDRILKNDVPLLVNAVKCAQEKPSIIYPHKHSTKQQLLHLGYMVWLVLLWPVWNFQLIIRVCFWLVLGFHRNSNWLQTSQLDFATGSLTVERKGLLGSEATPFTWFQGTVNCFETTSQFHPDFIALQSYNSFKPINLPSP